MLQAVSRLCNGGLAWREVAAELDRHWQRESLEPFLAGLAAEGALVEAPRAASAARPSAPSRVLPGTGPYGRRHARAQVDLATLLRSPKHFGTFADRAVPVELLASLLSLIAHDGPVEVAVLRTLPASPAARRLEPGIYRPWLHQEGGISFEHTAAVDGAWRRFGDPRILTYASAALAWADGEPAGAQHHARIAAASLGLACEVRNSHAIIGMRPDAEEESLARSDDCFHMREGVHQAAGFQPAGFAYIAWPAASTSTPIRTTGRAADPRLAMRKAEAEAWERLGWATTAPSSRTGPMHAFPQAIDPSTVIRYSAHQYRQPAFPFAPLSQRRHYAWVRGYDTRDGQEVLLPADCVHALSALPGRPNGRPLTSTSTSGVAAWTDRDGALAHATLELLERDAFLRQWCSGAGPHQVVPHTLPAEARRRLAGLEAAGCRVSVAEIGERAPVFTVFAQHTRHHFSLVTAGTDFDAETALGKALDEAEARVLHNLKAPRMPRPGGKAASSRETIDQVYRSARFYRRADFYGSGPFTVRFGSVARTLGWTALQHDLTQAGHRLLAFDLTPPGAAIGQGREALHVMRAVIPGTLPIWFAQGLEPAGLLPLRNTFIHPFL